MSGFGVVGGGFPGHFALLSLAALACRACLPRLLACLIFVVLSWICSLVLARSVGGFSLVLVPLCCAICVVLLLACCLFGAAAPVCGVVLSTLSRCSLLVRLRCAILCFGGGYLSGPWVCPRARIRAGLTL